MYNISISPAISKSIPDLLLGIITAEVHNTPHNDLLWKKISEQSEKIIANYPLDVIKNQPQIHATREAYKLLGKDPNRYRPSAEALYRRIVKGYPLYQISTLVDLINLISLSSGYSIGGFDADKINGKIRLDVGSSDDSFFAIGRGELNIENLPVYYDESGPIGTPTSDHVRTSIDMNTNHIFMIINAFRGNREMLSEWIEVVKKLIELHTNGKNIADHIIKPQ